MLMAVACASPGEGSTRSAPEAVGEVEALRQRVNDLEVRLRWTETDAIEVVREILSVASIACRTNNTTCRQYISNLLRGGHEGTLPFLLPTATGMCLKRSEWSAVRESLRSRWLVTSANPSADGTHYQDFYVYERTGLVEAALDIPPSARRTSEQIGDDRIRKVSERLSTLEAEERMIPVPTR